MEQPLRLSEIHSEQLTKLAKYYRILGIIGGLACLLSLAFNISFLAHEYQINTGDLIASAVWVFITILLGFPVLFLLKLNTRLKNSIEQTHEKPALERYLKGLKINQIYFTIVFTLGSCLALFLMGFLSFLAFTRPNMF